MVAPLLAAGVVGGLVGMKVGAGLLMDAKEKYIGQRLSQRFSADTQEELLKDFEPNFVLSKNSFNYQAMEDYKKNKASNISIFGAIRTPDGSKFLKRLEVKNRGEEELDQAAKSVKYNIENSLRLKDDFSEQDFIKDMKSFYKLCEKTSYNQKTLEKVLDDISSTALNNVTAQHKAEKEALEEKFNDETFKENLKTLGIDDLDLEPVKKSMIDALDKKHAEQFSSVEQAISGNKNKLNAAAAMQTRQFLYLKNLCKHNSSMKKALDAVIEKKAAENQRIKEAIEAGQMKEPENFNVKVTGTLNDLSFKDIEDLETITGRPVKQGEDGAFIIQYGVNISPWEWKSSLDPRGSVKADMRSLAEMVKATGSKGIKYDLQFSDPELANKRAKQALEAALEAGFALEDIKINLNGKEYKKGGEHKFSDFIDQTEINLAQAKGKQHNEKIEKLFPKESKEAVQEAKQQLAVMREEVVKDQENESYNQFKKEVL